MILGTCNFGRNYNGVTVSWDESLKMIEYFQNNGGKIIDTAWNYGDAQDIINQSIWSGKIITKVWKSDEIEKSMNRLNKSNIYCVMAREPNAQTVRSIQDAKNKGIVDKVGMSIYYPHELRENVSVLHIPASRLFEPYLDTMTLYADVIIRSVYNLRRDISEIKELKKNNRPDLGHTIDFCVGCDSLEQLKRNMEIFG